MSTKDIEKIMEENEEKILEQISSARDKKREKLKPRELFLLKNSEWITMVILRKSLEKTDLVDYPIEVESLKEWCKNNNLFSFQSKKDLIVALANWMYENLKILKKGGKELKDIENFGRKESDALLKGITIKTPPINDDSVIYDYQNTFFPRLTKALHDFLKYVGRISQYEGARLGFFKIGVCPYQRRKEADCGKIFIAWDFDSEACPQHAAKYRALKGKRKERLKKKLI